MQPRVKSGSVPWDVFSVYMERDDIIHALELREQEMERNIRY